MKISVAMTAYCGGEFIAAQLESIFRQTMVPDEVIIGDDSPDDAVRNAVYSVAVPAGTELIYMRNPVRLGINGNMANILSSCRGEIILMADQDDVWLPDRVEKLVHAMESSGAGGAFCDSCAVDSSLNDLGYSLWDMRGFNTAERRRFQQYGAWKIFLRKVYASGHNMAFRRELLQYILPMPEFRVLYFDTWIALCTAAFSGWTAVDGKLTLYRIHGANHSAPGMPGLLSQIRSSAKAHARGFLSDEVTLCDALLKLPLTSPERRQSVLKRRGHYRCRISIGQKWYLRIFLTAYEFMNGNYFRYSNGLKSLLSDIFF